MTSITSRCVRCGAALATIALAAGPAWAGAPIPGPLLGGGLPALAVIGGGYLLIRRYRQR